MAVLEESGESGMAGMGRFYLSKSTRAGRRHRKNLRFLVVKINPPNALFKKILFNLIPGQKNYFPYRRREGPYYPKS
jgi:hypothetical protein